MLNILNILSKYIINLFDISNRGNHIENYKLTFL